MLIKKSKTLTTSLLIILVSLNLACSKKQSQNFKGTIIESCDDHSTVGGVTVEIHLLKKGLPGFGGATGRSFSYSTTSNANGGFSLEFTEKDWGLDDAGTYGAELIVDGNTVLNGITSGDNDLGNVLSNPPMTIDLIATISPSNLFSDDTVYVNNQMVGVGNFPAFTDTFNVHISYFDNEPNFEENGSAGLHWRIVNPDTTQPGDVAGIQLTDRCQKSAALVMEISR